MTPLFILRVLLLGSLLSTFAVGVSAQTLVERLGYPPETKLIIVHGDDLGEADSVNGAAIAALQGAPLNSERLLVACRWLTSTSCRFSSPEIGSLAIHTCRRASIRAISCWTIRLRLNRKFRRKNGRSFISLR